MTVVVRNACSDDAVSTGRILFEFQQGTDWMPKLYTFDEVVGFCRTMIERGWVTVAQDHGRVVGFLARDRDEVCSLYLASDAQGRGFGRALLAQAKEVSSRLTLRTFEANAAAQRFYDRQGFIEIARSDGATNEEGLSDITYQWAKGFTNSQEAQT